MSAAEAQRTPEDLTPLHINEDWHLHFWSAKFSVTPEALAAAAKEAGPRTEDVQAQLHKAARTAFRMGGED